MRTIADFVYDDDVYLEYYSGKGFHINYPTSNIQTRPIRHKEWTQKMCIVMINVIIVIMVIIQAVDIVIYVYICDKYSDM
jgi:hypothetical protein